MYDNPYKTLLFEPFPVLEEAEKDHPKDIDHTPAGMLTKLIPVLTVFVFTNGINAFELISNDEPTTITLN